MADTSSFPNYQDQAAGATPVYLALGGTAVGTGNPIPTANKVVSASPTSFQQTATTSAVALPSHAYTVGMSIVAPSANTGVIYVGASGVTALTGYPLSPGQSISYSINNSNLIFILGTVTTDKVAVTGV